MTSARSLATLLVLAMTTSCAGQPWRLWRPTIQAVAPDVQPPAYEIGQLDNGLTLLVASMPEQPVVSVRITARAGALAERLGPEGVAPLTYRTMAYARPNDVRTSEMRGEFGLHGASFEVTVAPKHAADGVQSMLTWARAPSWSEAAFMHARQSSRDSADDDNANPQAQGELELRRLVFGESHPYARRLGGSPRSLDMIGLHDVRAFHARHVAPQALALVVSGPVTLRDVKTWTATVGDWAASDRAAPSPLPALELRKREHVVVVPKAGATQATILTGRAWRASSARDEVVMSLADRLLAGIAQYELRQKQGATYGAGYAMDGDQMPYMLTFATSVRADATADAIYRLLETRDVRDTVWQRTSNDWKGGLLIGGLHNELHRTATAGGMSRAMSEIFLRRLRPDHFAQRVAAFHHVRYEPIAAAVHFIERELQPGLMQIVVVGDPNIVGPQLDRLDLSYEIADG